MQVPSNYLPELYTELKFWLPACGALWTVFKVVSYVKSIKENDLVHVQLGIDSMHNEMKAQTLAFSEAMEKQTKAVIDELKEMRNDFRTFYRTQDRADLQEILERSSKMNS